jgi:hypothetical protein
MTTEEAFTPPSREEAARLYRAAAAVKELAPWGWMDEAEVFGAQDPETGALGFVSVMGMGGEHFAVAVYLGARALHDFWEMEDGGALSSPLQLLDIPQLQASFEDRDQLDKQDRDLIKEVGLKFRGRKAWPLFRSYRPGFMPWFVTTEEARLLTHALEQTLEVAPRVRDNPDMLQPGGDRTYLVRVPHPQGDAVAWEDQAASVHAPESEPVRLELDAELLPQLGQLPRRQFALEVDLLSLPTGIGGRGERPARPYVLALADARSGMILSFEMLQVEITLAALHAQAPANLAAWLAQAGALPAEIRTRPGPVADRLRPLAQALNVGLSLSDELPAVEGITDYLFGFLAGEGF